MAEADLFHRISTHAVSGPFDTTGLRSVELNDRDAARVLPREALADLDDLLRKTTPAGSATGYVVRRYAAGRESFVCVVATYPDLVQDAQARKGSLTHARVIRVDSPRDVWRDVPALVEAAESFPIGDICAVVAAERLAAYLDLVSGETTVTLHPLAIVELQQLPSAFLTDFLTAMLATSGDKGRTRFVVLSTDALAERLAMAWCALPAMLQRRSSYALGVGEGCPVDAIFSMTAGRSPADVASETLVRYVKQYVTLLSDAPDAVDSILRNPGITDVSRFGEAIDRATVAAPRLMASGKGAMAKKDKPRTGGRDDIDALDPEVVAELNRQFDALEAEMRMLIEQRIEDLEARNVLATRQGRVPFWKDPRVWPPLLVALIAIATFSWMWPRGVRNATPTNRVIERRDVTSTADETPPPIVNDTVDPEQAVLARVVTSAAATQLWADAFKDLVANDGVIVTRFISVAMNDSEVESDATVRELQSFANKIAGRQDLRPEGRVRLRALLLDYIAKQVASADGVGAQVKVDGDLRDVKTVLERVKTRTGVKSTELDVNGNHLQSEIILRWMESHPR